MKIKHVPASEWSGMSTKRQVDMAKMYGEIHVTWHGVVELIVRHAEQEIKENGTVYEAKSDE